MPTGCRSVYLSNNQSEPTLACGGLGRPYRLVISNVVPKIWARTNSAMMLASFAVAKMNGLGREVGIGSAEGVGVGGCWWLVRPFGFGGAKAYAAEDEGALQRGTSARALGWQRGGAKYDSNVEL